MLGKFFKGFFVLALVFLASWLLVIGYWRFTGTDPSGADLALYLVALPIVFILAFLGLKALAKRRGNADAEPDGQNANARGAGDEDAPPRPEDYLYLCVLDTAVRLPVGHTGEDALALLAEGKTRPGLDKTLVDDQGFPVFATRVEDINDEDIEQSLVLPETHDDLPVTWSAEQRRALAMGRDILDELLMGQVADVLAQFPQDPAPPPRSGSPTGSDHDTVPPDLRIRLFLPGDWAATHRESATAWLREHTEDSALHPRLTVVAEHATPHDHAPGFSDLSDFSAAADAEERDTICILLACSSLIGEAAIARLSGDGELFSQANPGGVVPGEGAAGLVAVSKPLIADMLSADYAQVHRAATAARQTRAADKNRRSADQALLGELTVKALANAQCNAEDVTCIVSDAGINSTQSLELAQLTSGDFTHLDPTADCPCIGTACGDLGMVSLLAAVGLGRTAVANTGGPVLAVSLSHPINRAAVVLQPTPEPESSSEDNAPARATA